jgi:BASS family bile acid:Na+ symporter
MHHFWYAVLIILIGVTFVFFIQHALGSGTLLVIGFLLLALFLQSMERLKGYAFTAVVMASFSAGMLYPQYFVHIGGYKLSKLILPLLQVIMFGMGTTVSFDDFINVVKTPKAVIIGLCCQFAIMPSLGFAIASLFNFPAEVAAGVILIGCSPSGLSSNVMCLIAKANVALSITITTCATLLAPLLTPLLMKWLAGQFIEINFWSMVWDITQIIIIPLGIGFVINQFFKKQAERLHVYLPFVSMAAIAVIIIIITSTGQASLLKVGGLLIVAVLLHNLGGYILGYSSARLLGMKEQDCRTIAIEVGLQNAGLASGLANQMGKIATVGLAAALFGPIMNISGSVLASWWGRPKNHPE